MELRRSLFMELKIVLSFLLYSHLVSAYSGGPPPGLCITMTPGGPHGSPANNNGSPFKVTVSNDTFSTGNTLTVTVSSATADKFVGLMLQARKVGGTKPEGLFLGALPSKTKYYDCSSEGADAKAVIVHNNPAAGGQVQWSSLSFNWKAPSTAIGDINFRVTVVKEKTVFYVGLESNTITEVSSSVIVPSPTAAVMPSSTVSLPTNAPSSNEFSTSECGKTKGCLLDSTSCTSSSTCNFLLSFSADENTITFEMSGKASGWVAVGFNDKKAMADGDVLACVQRSGTVTLEHYVNNGKTPIKSAKVVGANLLSTSVTNGIIKCRFTREKNATVSNGKDLNSPWYLIVARGKNDGSGNIAYHSWRQVSSEKVDVAKVFVVASESTSITLLLVHGSLMIIAWLGCAGTGVIFARYLRNVWGDFLGLKLWFQVHRAVMISAVLLSIIAVICVFVHVKAWSPGIHPILGIIVVSLATIQPIIAIFRPHPGEPNRAIFNWVHRSIAVVAFLLSLVCIFTGLKQKSVDPGQEAVYGLIVFIVIFVVLCIVLEISSFMKKKKCAKGTLNVGDNQGKQEMTLEQTPPDNDFGLRKGVLAVFLLVMLGVVITILVLLVSKASEGSSHDHNSDSH